MRLRIIPILLLLFTIVLAFAYRVSASSFTPIAASFSMKEKPPIGAIVAQNGDGFRLSSRRYDTRVVGVVVETSDLIIKYEEDVQGIFTDRYIVDGGEVDVLINDSNGTVQKGDYVTTSDSPGEGMRADTDGVVLGIALEDFKAQEGKNTDMVRVAVDIRVSTVDDALTIEALFAKYGIFGSLISTLLNTLKIAPAKMSQAPLLFRYVLSIFLLIAAIIFGFLLFGRVAIRGIESLGRNPLARWTILSGIFINITFITLMIGFALILAYFIVTL